MEVSQIICDVCGKEVETNNDVGPEYAILNKFSEKFTDENGVSRLVMWDRIHICKQCFHSLFPKLKGYYHANGETLFL